MTYESQLEALGDPTRRAILEQLLRKPQPVGKLAEHFPISRPAISQHLRLLKECRLVQDEVKGTQRIYRIDPAGFESLRTYFERFWSTALEAFKHEVEKQ